MYYPRPQKEPSGCLQTLAITKAILMILAVPLGFIGGAIFAIVMAFYAFSVSPFLGLAIIVGVIVGIFVFYKWESARILRDNPPDDAP
jgi:hypothetical protein